MTRMHKVAILLFLTAIPLASLTWGAQLRGRVRDGQKLPLPGVTVVLTQKGAEVQTVWTDPEGIFFFSAVAPGSYQLRASLDGFGEAISEVAVREDANPEIEVILAPNQFSEQVEVTAEKPVSGAAQVLEERRTKAVVSEALAREDMAKSPDADAAAAVQRITGISTVGNRYVYVRGLGERYATVLLNGCELPSTETEKRVIPLDLFPTKLLDQVTVVKSFAPDLPGSFGGGLVQLNTSPWPEAKTFSVRVGSGENSQVNGQFRRYAGGLSFDGSGGQWMPVGFPSTLITRATRFNPKGFTPEQLQDLGRKLSGAWTGKPESSAPPQRSFALSYGQSFGNLGVVFSGTQSQSFSRNEETQTFYGLDSGQMVPVNDYRMVTYGEGVRWGLFGSLGWKLSKDHSVRWNSLFSRNARASDRQQEGYNTNSGNFIRDLRSRYWREDLTTHQLSGEHFLSGLGQGLSLEWRASLGKAQNLGDLRENIYGLGPDGVFRLLVGFPEVGRIEFYRLQEDTQDGSLALSQFLDLGSGVYSAFKVGTTRSQRERTFLARRFKFVTTNPNQFDLSLPPDQLFQPANIRPDGFELREVTGVNDAYSGTHNLTAYFAQADVTWGKVRTLLGLRLEDSDQEVVTVNPFDTRNADVARLVNKDWLPALNVTYAWSARTNLRFAASRTVNRPEFRELSPFAFVEITGGRSVVGNPNLRRSLLDSVEVRWETFPEPGEVVAFSVFAKRITDPIERIIQPTTELRSSWTNAKEANLQGVELEYRRSLGHLHPSLQNLVLNANYAFIDSEVTVPPRALSVVTSSNRPLQGQARHVLNFTVEYYYPRWGSLARLLYNFTGRRLSEVGAYGLADIYEEDNGTWDLFLRQQLRWLLPGLEVNLSAANLTDNREKFTQGPRLQRQTKMGRTVSVSFGYALQ